MSRMLPRAIDAAFVTALAVLGVVAAWPIYRSAYLLIAAVGAVLIAGGLSALGAWRGWSWFRVGLLTLAAYLVFGVPLAIPSALGSPAALANGYRELLGATVFAWKQLVTVALPVGGYQQLLVPFFLLLLLSTTAALGLAWRAVRLFPFAVPVMLVPIAFGLAFGSSEVSAPLRIVGWALPAPRETVIGLATLVLAGGFLNWRMQHARNEALRRASRSTGIRRSGGVAFGRVRRAGLTVLSAAVAIGIAVPATAAVLEPSTRSVLRTAIDPSVELREQISPLTRYRASFEGSAYDQALFTVSGDTAAVPRLRLATLGFYDGQQAQVVPDAGGAGAGAGAGGTSASAQGGAFARVPQLVDGAGASKASGADTARITVTVNGYKGIWAPTVGRLDSISFAGSRSAALTGGFYYDATLQAGVELHPLVSGDRYTLDARPAVSVPPLDRAQKPQAAPAPGPVPASLTQWIKAQDQPSDAAGLAELISRLRARGYLSHSLEAPGAPTAGGATWLSELGGSVFASSLSGESLDRIGTMFTQLLTKQNSTDSDDDSRLVAAVGDDEQFSVAAAMIAQQLGFPARVVLGFALNASASDAESIPACQGGVCRGKNLTAWVEVQDAAGAWIPVDTTPQHTHPLSPETTQQRDPRNLSQVDPQTATQQQPPEQAPSGSNQNRPPRHDAAQPSGWWKPIVMWISAVLLVLLVIVAPFASILAVKSARRRERRGASTPSARIAGGWDELVDIAVDHGYPRPSTQTRSETVAQWSGAPEPAAGAQRGLPTPLLALAESADAAAFGDQDPSDAAANQFWALVGLEQARLRGQTGLWGRMRALFTLRSFTRFRGPR